MNKNIEEVLLTAVYETDKFKRIAKNYIDVKKIKNKACISDITESFNSLVLEAINENIDSFKYEDNIKDIRKKLGSSTLKLKGRWMKNAIDKHLPKELEYAEVNYVKNGCVNSEFKTVDDLREGRLKFLEEWKSDIRNCITNYPYLYVITDKKLDNAFKNDIVLCITEELMTEYNFNIENITIKTPSPVAPSLFNPVKVGRKKEVEDIKYKSELLTIIEGEGGDQIDYFYEIEKPKTEEESFKLKLNNSYELDQQDLDIIRYAYTYSYHDFNSFSTTDVLKFLGLARTPQNQERIENKFLKLPKYTFYAEKVSADGKIKSKTAFNLFSGVNITINEDNGERIISTMKSNLFRLNPFSMEIMYKKELEKLQSDDAKSVAYLLEGARLYLISQGIDLSNYVHNIPMREFRKYMKVDINKKKEAKEKISAVLDEIIENQFILKSYEIGSASFNIHFYESDERKKLLIKKTIISLPEEK